MLCDHRFPCWLLAVSISATAPVCDSLAQADSSFEACDGRPVAKRASAREGKVLEGPISWVTDGDSVWVRVEGREVEVRLADIDAPERDQPYGWEAKLGLIDLLRGRHVMLIQRDVDRHGRIIARVWTDELDVSRELVRRGLAWFYPAFRQDAALLCDERQARAARRGLWAQATPQAPWTHRRAMRQRE